MRGLLVDDHHIGAVSEQMQVKIGAYLTNQMVNTLKYKVGNHQFMLLRQSLITSGVKGKSPKGGKNIKNVGYINFNKGFVEEFI